MDALKPFFPFVFSNVEVKEKDVNSLVISIIIHLVAGLIVGIVLGFVAGILGEILGLLGVLVGLIDGLFGLYCLIGIVLAVLKFLNMLK